MCGIAGFISAGGNVDTATINRMTDIIAYRGPDDDGQKIFSIVENDLAKNTYIALGHRRLSIVDLSSLGHQPMSYKDGRYWIVYNGEIYNYLELRSELNDLGHEFVSQTDTEVILAAYAEWGESCQQRFNGMWAFSIYDQKEKKLFLSRDRFGIKPLYYWVSPHGGFYFGSEIKQFTVVPDWDAVLNHQRAYDFLVFGLTDHTEETMFKGVLQILPGHSLTLDVDVENFRRVLPQKKWYSLKDTPFKGTFEHAKAEFYKIMTNSVRMQMRADVPIGSCLSGGLDSSTIVCLMNEVLKDSQIKDLQKTFSACSHVEAYNEKKWIDIVVSRTGVEDHYCYPDVTDLFEKADQIIWHQDEPFGSTSIFAQWSVFKLASQEGVRVMLDGQGADEQLAGYFSYFGVRLASLFKAGRWKQLWREADLFKRRQGKSWLWIGSYFLRAIMPRLLVRFVGAKKLMPDWLDLSSLRADVRDLDHNYASSSVYDLSYSQLTTGNLRMLLHWEDRDSMAHSVESRVPFLDHRLVEFCLGIPEDFKIFDGVSKRVLRESMRGVLPDAIADRADKIGFATPEEVWMRENPQIFRTKMREAIQYSFGILRPSAMRHLDDVLKGTARFDFSLWRMISFGMWMRIFNVKLDP